MRWLVVCFVLCMANAQAPLPEPSLLDKVRARASENLRRLPNYTCTEAIERSVRLGRTGRLRLKDTVRLNVAYVGGKELFGLPGTGRMEHANLEKLVGGTIGNGQFALFVRSILLEQGAEFSPSIDTKLKSERAFRFNYAMPLSHSKFVIHSARREATVGYSGAFWVTADTLDLMRLTVSGDDLLPQLELASDVTTTDYGPIRIGGTEFLLPVRSSYAGQDRYGSEVRNTVTFENCHEFVGESVLKFDEAESAPANK